MAQPGIGVFMIFSVSVRFPSNWPVAIELNKIMVEASNCLIQIKVDGEAAAQSRKLKVEVDMAAIRSTDLIALFAAAAAIAFGSDCMLRHGHRI
jgi:hypothetical protein